MMYVRRLIHSALLCLVGILSMTVPCTFAFAKEPLQVVGFAKSDYTRLLFYCKQPATFTPALDGKSLTVQFDRELEVDFSRLVDVLGARVTAATLTDDSKTVKFELPDANYSIRKFVGENFVGVDVVRVQPSPAEATAAPALKPAQEAIVAAAPKAERAPVVPKENAVPTKSEVQAQNIPQALPDALPEQGDDATIAKPDTMLDSPVIAPRKFMDKQEEDARATPPVSNTSAITLLKKELEKHAPPPRHATPLAGLQKAEIMLDKRTTPVKPVAKLAVAKPQVVEGVKRTQQAQQDVAALPLKQKLELMAEVVGAAPVNAPTSAPASTAPVADGAAVPAPVPSADQAVASPSAASATPAAVPQATAAPEVAPAPAVAIGTQAAATPAEPTIPKVVPSTEIEKPVADSPAKTDAASSKDTDKKGKSEDVVITDDQPELMPLSPVGRMEEKNIQDTSEEEAAAAAAEKNKKGKQKKAEGEQPEGEAGDADKTKSAEQEQLEEENAEADKILEQPVVGQVIVKTIKNMEPLPLEKLKEISTEGTMVFPWAEEGVGAAVVKRGAYLWVVFDRSKVFDIKAMVAANSSYMVGAEQIENKHYTILRFQVKNAPNFVAYKDGTNWVVAGTKEKIVPPQSPEISVAMSELHGSTVVIPSAQKTKPIRLIDPEIGDEMVVIPYADEGFGMASEWKYPDFVLIKTVQGVVAQLISDDIALNTANQAVKLAGPANRLAGSAQSALRELQERERESKLRAEQLKQKASELALIKFKTWSMGGDKLFDKNLHTLEWSVTEASWADKNRQRLQLARFYIANGLAIEALGVISVIQSYDQAFGKTNDVKILEAVGNYMAGRYQEAADAFDSIDISKFTEERDQDEAKFWKAAIYIQLDHQVKMDKFMSSNPLEEQKKEKEQAEGTDKVESTKLMLETSSRLLKLIRKMDPDFVNAKEVQTLESTARFVADHYHDAIRRFEETDLFRSGDVFEAEQDKLWWSTTSSHKGDNVEFPFLENKNRFLKYYPTALYDDFAVLALEDRIQKNDLGAAEEILQSFREDDKRPFFKNSVEFLKGLFHAKDEEPEKAEETWKKVALEIPDRFNRTRAIFALTVYQLQRKEIDIDQAIKNFNTIRSSWRGGVLELNVLKLLGEFYMDKKDYMNGFKVWREAVATFPSAEESLLIAKRMSEKFVQIFNQGDADSIPQLEALTLYYEFRELTPIGKLGDEMITRLADRLIQVDLLDRAAALLTHQVRFRLSGEERDKATVKLVKVHLANQDPQAALDVLNATETTTTNTDLALEKKYLKVKALIELGKNNQALSFLRNDDSHMASYLRADVYWRKKVWKKVIEELETPFRELRREERPLTEQETEQLLRLAVAYAVIERKKRLQILYEDFKGLINNDEKQKILTFVASDRGQVDYRDLDYTVGYDDMQSFLKRYLESEGTPGAAPEATGAAAATNAAATGTGGADAGAPKAAAGAQGNG